MDESYRRGRTAVSALAAVVATVAAAWALLLFRRFRPSRVAIEGSSMAPTLLPGDWVLTIAPRGHRTGDVVVLEHPRTPGVSIVKRLAAVPGQTVAGRVLGEDEHWVEGDFPPASTDSRDFGAVPAAALRERVVAIYWPPGRRRFVR